jgi:hypothetical protein
MVPLPHKDTSKPSGWFRVSLLFAVLFLPLSCAQEPDFPVEPVIEFVSISSTQFYQFPVQNDSIILVFSFTDGDGDLGDEDKLNLFLTDSRIPNTPQQFRLPFIPKEGVANGISGEVTMKLATTCCIYPDLSPPCSIQAAHPTNSLHYSIQIEDRAGNRSNSIRTPDLIMRCIP